MTLDKIEVNYPRATLRYKVKFAENRKPTYIEFILIQIIISYADREQMLKNILENELGIENPSLFQRAMRDLLNFNIVRTSVNIDEQDFDSLLNVKLVNLTIANDLRNDFIKNNYMINNIIKTIELKYIYDPLTKKTFITQKIDWEKKFLDSQCNYKLFQREDINYKMNVNEIRKKTEQIMKEEPSLFGENCELIDVQLLDDTPIAEIQNSIDIFYEYEQVAIKALVNFDEDKYQIETESRDLRMYFENNQNVNKEFIDFIFETYNKKISEVIKGKTLSENENSLENAVLLQDFPSKLESFDFFFFNFNDLNSRSKMLERPKYIENAKIIFEYNINGDEVRIGYERKKILVATHMLNNLEHWKNATLVYANFNKNIHAYNVEKVYVPSIGQYLYIGRIIETFENKISFDLKETFDHIRELFHTSLKFGDYDKVALCIGLLFKLDEKSIVEKIMNQRLYADLNYAREYTAIKKSLLKYGLKEELVFMEELTCRIIIASKQKFSSMEFIKMLPKYSITQGELLVYMIQKMNFDFTLEQLQDINLMLTKQNIDGWKINLNNSLVKYLKLVTNSKDIKINVDNVAVIQIHNEFLTQYNNFIISLKAKKSYPELVGIFKKMYKAEINLLQNMDPNMQNKVDYLDIIGKMLNGPLKAFKEIIDNYIELNINSPLAKLKLLAKEFLTSRNEKLITMIRPNTISESVEINKAIFFKTNDELLGEELIGDAFRFNESIEIYYAMTSEESEDIILKKLDEWGED